jgi:drug/metabolite transporter (DMT)-like permease
MGMMSVIFFRMLVASLFFLFFIKSFRGIEFTKRSIKLLLIMVFFEPCMYFIFEINALTYTTAGQAGVITSFMPLITAFAAGVFLSEIIKKEMIIGSVIAIIGAVWLSLISNSAENASNPLLGNFLEMLAMVCGAGYTIVLRHLVKDFSPLFLTAIQSFAGTLFFLPLTIFEYSTSSTSFSLDSALAVIYLGSVVTLGGYGLYNYAVSRTTAANASSFINLIPVFTLIIAFLVLDEVLDYEQLLACSLILLGVVITQTKFLKPKRDTIS